MPTRLSIVIVNYNVRYFVEQCIQSILNSDTNIPYEIIVVDNASSDYSVEHLKEKFQDICFIENETNVGFSTANNIGFHKATGTHILILNPDTILQENTLKKCMEFYMQTPMIGALGVRMIDGSGHFLRESKRGFPGPWNSFCKFSGLYRLFPNSKFFNGYYAGHIDEYETAPIDVLTGAFMLIQKDILLEAGGFDEDYFMYGEDIDLSYKIQLNGYRNYYFPESSIVHFKGESTKKGSLNYVKVFYEAMIIFAQKHLRHKYSGFFIGFLRLAIVAHGFITLLKNIAQKTWLIVFEGAIVFYSGFIFQKLWARFHFENPQYYKSSFLIGNLIIYSLIFISSMFLHGSYDHPFKVNRIRKGATTAFFIAILFYALAPLDFRTSRVVLIATFILSLLIILIVRSLLKWTRTGSFNLFLHGNQRMAVIGSQEEYDRLKELIHPLNVDANLLGRISAESDDNYNLGNLRDLEDIISFRNIDSLIFCSADVSRESMMKWMTQLGKQVEFKMLPEKSSSIIGSASRNLQGELYTIELQYRIQDIENIRAKRVFDLLSSIAYMFIGIFWLVNNKGRENWLSAYRVFSGKKSWIGYAQPIDESLPKIKEGIWPPHLSKNQESNTKMINFLYARDYRWYRDLELWIKNIVSYE